MHKYKIVKNIGVGAFGEVHLALMGQQQVAVKTLKQKYTDWQECLQLREIKSLLKLKHTSIIALKQVLQVQDQLHLIFEYLPVNLYDGLLKQHSKSIATESTIRNIIRQIAQGLAYMHRMGIFHRDLKPENILLSDNYKQAKICDFGLARQVRSAPPYTDYVSTRWYRAPELVLRMNSYNSPVDVFALGCIMAELYSGTALFPGSSETDQLNKIFRVLGTPSNTDWPEMYKWSITRNIAIPQYEGEGLNIKNVNGAALQLIRQMLRPNPKNRITSANILKHKYFSDEQSDPIKKTIESQQVLKDISNTQQIELSTIIKLQQPKRLREQISTLQVRNNIRVRKANSLLKVKQNIQPMFLKYRFVPSALEPLSNNTKLLSTLTSVRR